jgi:uncharacterized protein (TIGR00251 family)
MPQACTIEIRLKPNARQNSIDRGDNGVLQVRVNAPPVEGKANAALIELLSDTLNIPKSRISIKRGAASRNKVVAVLGMTKDEALRRFSPGMDYFKKSL